METIQINNYKIEFYNEEEWITPKTEYSTSIKLSSMSRYLGGDSNNTLYAGLVLKISEELAEQIVENWYNIPTGEVDRVGDIYYRDYKNKAKSFPFISAKQSFQTLNELEYCVISKI